MIITIFRSRLLPGVNGEYLPLAEHMVELATGMPGYIAHKGFLADDGERVTIVEFESEETQRAWKMNAEHRVAQKLGRERFYAEYRLTVCNVLRESRFKQPSDAQAAVRADA